jgi:hypothetical protein
MAKVGLTITLSAMTEPRALKREIARPYRNRLAHHIRPSVNYPMFLVALESRVGEEIKDAQGNVIGRRFPCSPGPRPNISSRIRTKLWQ